MVRRTKRSGISRKSIRTIKRKTRRGTKRTSRRTIKRKRKNVKRTKVNKRKLSSRKLKRRTLRGGTRFSIGDKVFYIIGLIALSPFILRDCIVAGFKWLITKIKRKD